MQTAYRIPKGAQVHSRYELTKIANGKKWPWVRIPTSLDTDGIKMLMATPGGVEAYGLYCLMVCVSANTPTQWLLANGNNVMDPRRLAVRIGCPVDVVERGLPLLLDADIAWLDVVEVEISDGCVRVISEDVGQGFPMETRDETTPPAKLPQFPEDDPDRCKAINAIERLMGKGLSAGQIDQFDQWAMPLPETIEINDKPVSKWLLIDHAAGSAIQAGANVRSQGGALKYLRAIIDRCIREGLPPGEFEQTTQITKARKSAAKADADSNVTPTEVQI